MVQDYAPVRVLGINAYECSNLEWENFTLHHIGGNAFRYQGQVGYTGYNYDTVRYINCDAYYCADSLLIPDGAGQGGLGDGYKYDPGAGTYYDKAYVLFDGCRAFYCSDDGFDPSGSGFVEIRNCWSFHNGLYSGDANGFKIGGIVVEPDASVMKIVTNCISALNGANGLHEINYAGLYNLYSHVYNNTFYGNLYAVQANSNGTGPTDQNFYRNNIAYNNTNGLSIRYYKADHCTWAETGHTADDWPWYTNVITVTNADFISMDATQLERPRKANGSLPDIDFLKLATDSPLIDAGVSVGLPYSGSAPDIGYAESGEDESPVTKSVFIGDKRVVSNGKTITKNE
jgi:hypothetical protein